MKIQIIFIILIIILNYGCKNSTAPLKNKEEFGIYLLKDTLLLTTEAKKISITSLELQDTPIIKIDDIIEYNWEEQVVIVKTEAFERFLGIEKKIKSVLGLPFVVVVNQQRVYLGNIYPMYSSYIHEDLPSINVAPFTEMRITRAPLQNIKDKRKDERIYLILAKNNKLKN